MIVVSQRLSLSKELKGEKLAGIFRIRRSFSKCFGLKTLLPAAENRRIDLVRWPENFLRGGASVPESMIVGPDARAFHFH